MRFHVIVAAAFMIALSSPAQNFGTLLDGHPVAALAPAGTRAVVLYFIASDCPISNRTLPEMLRVRAEFRSRSVAFWFVYPNTTDTPQTVRDHATAYHIADATLLDPAGSLVALTQARDTPQAAILIPARSGWKPIYLGRIDDRYVRLGLERPQATRHFVELAVSQLLAGRPIQPASGASVGCAIVNPQAQPRHTAQLSRILTDGRPQ